jgi:hypothetical protein
MRTIKLIDVFRECRELVDLLIDVEDGGPGNGYAILFTLEIQGDDDDEWCCKRDQITKTLLNKFDLEEGEEVALEMSW